MNQDLKDFLAKAAGLTTIIFGAKLAHDFTKQILAIVWFFIFGCCMAFMLLAINLSF